MNSFIAFIANIYVLLFKPIGGYKVTTTQLLEDGETWADRVQMMNQGELNRFLVRVRPDLCDEYGCKSLSLKSGEKLTFGSTDICETITLIERD